MAIFLRNEHGLVCEVRTRLSWMTTGANRHLDVACGFRERTDRWLDQFVLIEVP
jgi:hypothetical protein